MVSGLKMCPPKWWTNCFSMWTQMCSLRSPKWSEKVSQKDSQSVSKCLKKCPQCSVHGVKNEKISFIKILVHDFGPHFSPHFGPHFGPHFRPQFGSHYKHVTPHFGPHYKNFGPHLPPRFGSMISALTAPSPPPRRVMNFNSKFNDSQKQLGNQN